MTVRDRRIGGDVVYAGTREELAQVADAYARGERALPHGYHRSLLHRTAAELRDGCRVINLGAIRFYADRMDGTPFHGPYAPDPDPEWLARRRAVGIRTGM